ncbi:MAG: Maf family protein [Defluviitaleaceae bacterium]|nr:Maf family protein [Defluviitaleaceae bacterium]MCL2835418.1 Maf family protein [Defluviitaleaceae bacterium]
MKIILASASPRRKALLDQIGLSFEVLSLNTEETDSGESAHDIVVANAEKKAVDAAETLMEDALIIAADTVVELDGVVLGKPGGYNDAFSMLSRLSGKRHTVHTGVCLYLRSGIPKKIIFSEQADVHMREIAPEEIHAYIKTGEPMDKAGSYGLQGFGAVFVRRVCGDYSTVIGLPLCALWSAMERIRQE